MRRIPPILAFALLLSVATSGAVARAHPAATAFVVPVGRTATVTIITPAETESPMVGIDVEVPATFMVDRAIPSNDWQVAMDGKTVRLRGEPIPLGGSLTVSLTGTISKRGELVLPVVTVAQDGTTKRWSGPPGQFGVITIYAGVSPPKQPSDGGGGGGQGLLWAGVMLVAVGAVAGAVMWRRRSATAG